MSKKKEISHANELLEILCNERIFEEYPGFSGSFRLCPEGGAEFAAEIGHERFRLNLKVILHPTRRLLKEERIGDGDLLACPHIAEPLALDLRREGIAHADPNGRLFLKTAGGLVDIRPGGIRYRSPRKGPDPFSPKAARIVRCLLCSRDSAVTQEELSERTGASRALVSQVLGKLADDDLVRQTSASSPGHPAFYELADFDRLLDAWKREDRWLTRTTVYEYSVLGNHANDIAHKLTDAVGSSPLAFTQWFAAWLRRPHTTPPVVSCYVKNLQILDTVPARRVKNGGNLWLIVPEDEGVWQQGQEVGGFPLVSDVQIYLDLLQIGQRGPETAEEFRRWEDFGR